MSNRRTEWQLCGHLSGLVCELAIERVRETMILGHESMTRGGFCKRDNQRGMTSEMRIDTLRRALDSVAGSVS